MWSKPIKKMMSIKKHKTDSIKLTGWDEGQSRFFELRLLSDEEVKFDQTSRPQVIEARNRLKLFKILEMNYKEWTNFLRKLLTPGSKEQENLLLLDKLMFNFMASAYGLMQHFEVSYRQRFKRKQNKIKEYDDFLKQLCSEKWAFAFFLDYRNYAQHFELPIGAFQRSEDTHSVRISITHDSAILANTYRGWKRSGLSDANGQLDLISLTEEFYLALRENYGTFMLKVFCPELKKIDKFYWKLTQEIRKKSPRARMVFLIDKDVKKDRVKETCRWTFDQPPNAVFEELGLSILKSK